MNLFTAMEVASSSMTAERTRMNALASNLANARTTRTAEGGPYKRLDPVFEAVPLKEPEGTSPAAGRSGVYTVDVPVIQQDEGAPRLEYDPNHPDADARGFVELPNVSVVQEMVNMITASRSYESGVTVMNSLKGMAQAALRIGG